MSVEEEDRTLKGLCRKRDEEGLCVRRCAVRKIKVAEGDNFEFRYCYTMTKALPP
jgi:hypothetical protein